MEKHGIMLSTETTLCGLSSKKNKGGYIFTEAGMKLRKGQQYNLFRDSVDCTECLEVGKTLVEETCSTCGTVL